ncbi:U-box domain-containing protein 21-like [Neltuma alba]|uniref:U-box domain-containing protein 21-like n=1 Tax=Neltuma alba TaxID=207710 RepID=UPI0010A2F06A|nr:U-box domain-containing protein 21-like [Prosopis alba]XP_028800526.1 U-box domain-containing protein 21-like [Prosopis alba]
MVLSGTLRKVFRRARKERGLPGGELDLEPVIPTHFRCPVSLELMKDPVTLCTGITYDRDSIERWIESGNNTCPVTKQVLSSTHMIPNHSIRKMIQHWCVENQSYGIERIPTPRIPVAPYEVSETCSRIIVATRNGDVKTCQELVGKIKNWGKESERNKRCIVENGACAVLASAFDSFSRGAIEENEVALDEILGVLPWMMNPSQEDARSKLRSEASLNCLVWFLNGNDLSARQNAAMVLKEMPVRALAKAEGVIEALVKMIREPIGPNATKASLTKIFQLVSSSDDKERISQRFVELGLVSLLLEAIVDADKSICEKALGVLDCLCDCKEGKEAAMANALALPLATKKILRVSALATEFSVSILWKLCDKEDEEVLVETVQLGAFQKLLLLLQVGCEESMKEKVTELLKLLNAYRSRAECVDSSLDFKYLKKPF